MGNLRTDSTERFPVESRSGGISYILVYQDPTTEEQPVKDSDGEFVKGDDGLIKREEVPVHWKHYKATKTEKTELLEDLHDVDDYDTVENQPHARVDHPGPLHGSSGVELPFSAQELDGAICRPP